MKTAKFFRRLIITVIILALLAAGFYFLVKNKIILVNSIFVGSGGVQGVDISSHQADVDMSALKNQKVSFVYMKATEGSSHTDSRFEANRAMAEAAGMTYGAYHFFSFDSPGDSQARHFIDVVGDLSGALVPAVDFEYYAGSGKRPDREAVITQLRTLLDILEEKYGAKPMIYVTKATYEDYIEGEIKGYPLWVRSVYYPADFGPWDEWTVWQYCDRGELKGYVNGERYIDLNVLNGSVRLEDLMIEK